MNNNVGYSYSSEVNEGVFCDNTFRIRLAVAAVSVLLIILFDITDTVFMGITTEQVYSAIATDYGADIAQLIEKAPQMNP